MTRVSNTSVEETNQQSKLEQQLSKRPKQELKVSKHSQYLVDMLTQDET